MSTRDLLESIKKAKLTFDLLPSRKSNVISTHSHVGGTPFMLEGEHPPLCHDCQQPMPFIFQLHVPYNEHESQLYAMYYCFHCKPQQGNRGFTIKTYRNPSIEQANQTAKRSPIQYGEFEFELYWSLPEWEVLSILHPRIADYFHSLDAEEYDVKYDEEKDDFLDMWNYDTFSFYGGYPNFLNAPVIPSCDCCQKPMKSFIQMDTHEELGLCWNKYGVLHVFQCSNNNSNFKILIQ